MEYQPNNYKNYMDPPSVVYRKVLTPYFLNNQSSCNTDIGIQELNKSEVNTPPPPPNYAHTRYVVVQTGKKDTGKVASISRERGNKPGLYNYRENTPPAHSTTLSFGGTPHIQNSSLNIDGMCVKPPSSTYCLPPPSSKYEGEYNSHQETHLKPEKNTTSNRQCRPSRQEEPPNKVYNKRSAFILSTIKPHDNTGVNYTNYCNNCGKSGHGFYQCKNPITSYGIIVFRYIQIPETNLKERQYLMIRRRDTISYVDFLRGKYSLFNRKYIKRLINDMSVFEQNQIMTESFDYLWYELWKNNEPNPNDELGRLSPSGGGGTPTDNFNTSIENTTGNEKFNVREKFNILQNGWSINGNSHFTITEIVKEIRMEQETLNAESWKEPEWGFCKGRRNYRENDYDCAVREMQEETGYSKEDMSILKNVNTFEEVFIGSNLKCYRHKYYLMYMSYENSLKTGDFEKTEVSCIKWVSFKECLTLIRSYNVEKKRMITDIENALNKYSIFN
jgi:8-oxo-dGTP pyrophosphatase MutT (NUDIX family)